MRKRKYFLTLRQIQMLLNMYGGYRVWRLEEKSSKACGYMVFKKKVDPRVMLTMNRKWIEPESVLDKYIVEIHLSVDGIIYQFDKWRYTVDDEWIFLETF